MHLQRIEIGPSRRQTHGVLLQYLDLLTSPSVVSPQDYANKVIPSLGELGEKYGIAAPICMQIVRPVLQGALLVRIAASRHRVAIYSLCRLQRYRCKNKNA
jgi:THO complex subunit 2